MIPCVPTGAASAYEPFDVPARAVQPPPPEPPQPSLLVAPGDVLDGKYRVERLLGRGGMGFVVAARHLHLGQGVAVKLLLPAISARRDAAARFLREGRAAARIRSAHVARVYDAGALPNGAIYLVLELLKGRDLRAELSAAGPLPVEEAVGHVIQACEGLAAAHAIGVIHRDLKPANLFLTRPRGGSPVVKIIDFGVSKVLPSAFEGAEPLALTGADVAVGTPHYMAPEQMKAARDVDVRADVFSLGATLFGLLTGAPPFTGDTMVAVYDRILAGPPCARDARPEVPVGLDHVITRCMAVRPEERYPDVGALAAALVPYGGPSAAIAAERVARELAAGPPSASIDEGGADGTTDRDGDTAARPFERTALTTPEEASSAGAPDLTEPPRQLTWLSTRDAPLPLSAAPTSPGQAPAGVDPPETPSLPLPEQVSPAPRRWPVRGLLLGALVAVVALASLALRHAKTSSSSAADPPGSSQSPPQGSGPPLPATTSSPAPPNAAPSVSNTISAISAPTPAAQPGARPRPRPGASAAPPTAEPATSPTKPWSPGPMDMPD